MEAPKKRIMVTVLDSINQTAMPYNEFILYRNKWYKEEQQVVILTGSKEQIAVGHIPESLIVKRAGKSPLKIWRILSEIVRQNRQEGQEVIIHIHSIQGALCAFMGIKLLGLRTATIYTIHSTFTGYKFYNKLFCAVNVLCANKVTCVSNTSYEKMPNFLKKIKGANMLALQNGVNEERINKIVESIPAPKHQNHTLKFVYVARVIPLKNHIFLIDVLSRVPKGLDIKFVFVGKEDPQRQIRAYAEKKGVADRIEWTGLIPREEVYKVLSSSDCYISSSTVEGLPVSVLEGMYCSLPAILSNIPQHKEVANDCLSAIVLPFDTDSWVKEITKFSSRGVDKRREMGIQSKEYVGASFSLKNMHDKYNTIYNQIAKQF